MIFLQIFIQLVIITTIIKQKGGKQSKISGRRLVVILMSLSLSVCQSFGRSIMSNLNYDLELEAPNHNQYFLLLARVAHMYKTLSIVDTNNSTKYMNTVS